MAIKNKINFSIFTVVCKLFSTNHKDIGVLYLAFAVIAGFIGVALSIYIRILLLTPTDSYSIEYENYLFNAIVIGHTFFLTFFFVVPALIGGLGNLFVPSMIGTSDMAFPRMNSLSFWLLPPALLLLVESVLCEMYIGGPNGATYPQFLTMALFSKGPIDLAMSGLYISGLASVLGATNFICTILNMRLKSVSVHRSHVFVWLILITSFLALLSLSILAGEMAVILTDPNLNRTFASPGDGENTLLYFHIYDKWFGYPKVVFMDPLDWFRQGYHLPKE